jgi:3-hydroxyacyl-[acyl-carrier-protein] dehydratase
MSQQEIEQRIPHRSPMLLIDEIVHSDRESIVCRKTFHAHEFFFQGHFPGQPIVPGVIQCECCLQAGALLLAAESEQGATVNQPSEHTVPVATRMDGVKFKRMVRPGDTVEIEVTIRERIGNACFLSGKVMRDGKLAARLDFACAIASAEPTDTAADRPVSGGAA